MAYTQADFDEWIFFLSDKLDYFTGPFAAERGLTLDYTPESLDVLEHWLLGKYEKSMDLVEDKEPYGNDYRLADLCGIYVGEVYRRDLVHDTGSAEKRLLQAPVSVIRDENGSVLHLPADLGHSLHPEKARGLYALGARELYRGEETTRG